jgi:hypothetical protein
VWVVGGSWGKGAAMDMVEPVVICGGRVGFGGVQIAFSCRNCCVTKDRVL